GAEDNQEAAHDGSSLTSLGAACDSDTVWMVGQDLQHLAFGQPTLHLPPESGRKDLAVCAQERRALRRIEGDEIDEGLREDIPLTDVEPGLATHLILHVAGLRQVAEVA